MRRLKHTNMIILKQFTSVEELYKNRKTPTGELIMDALIEAINLSKTVHPGDIALLMDVDERALRYAVQLLTGMTLKDILHHWRVLQAKELWDAQCAGFKNYKEFAKEKSKDAPEGFLLSREVVDQYKNDVSIKSFEAVAKRVGWDSYKSLLRVAKQYGITFEIARFVKKD